MDGILTWMGSTAVAQMVLQSAWIFPALETLHFIGLILLVGSLYVVDLRYMGFAPRIPLKAVLSFIHVSIIGFVINLSTGTLFLFADPFRYYPNLAFRLKMLAILLAGLNVIWFKLMLKGEALESNNLTQPRPMIRWIAGVSLLLWTSVIVFGRMIPYME